MERCIRCGSKNTVLIERVEWRLFEDEKPLVWIRYDCKDCTRRFNLPGRDYEHDIEFKY